MYVLKWLNILKRKTKTSDVGICNGTATFVSGFAVSYKLKIHLTYDLSMSPGGIYFRKRI